MPPCGFNVIGYISANLGLGAAARTTIRLLLEQQHPVSVIDIDAGFGRSGSDTSFDYLRPTNGGEAPYNINLIHMNPPELEALYHRAPTWLIDGRRMNVIVPFWELPRIPVSWIPTLERMDLILAPSHFIEHQMATQIKTVPVRHFPQTVFFPDGVTADRAAFGLPDHAVLFVTSFEMQSDMNRKNPTAVIDAFLNAFPARNDVRLVIKVNNPRSCTSTDHHLETLHELSGRDRRIVLIEQSFSYAQVLSLYASCDVLVSLHRSEGLGLAPMEAMLLGKPVIATAWSGVMDFMTDQNSCLVPCTLVPVPETSDSGYNAVYAGGPTVWACGDIVCAAAWMRRLADNPEVRAAIGAAAAQSMRERHERVLLTPTFENVRTFKERRWTRSIPRPLQNATPSFTRRTLRVLFQNRANAFEMSGGDTIVMLRLKEQLERRGVSVDFSSDPLNDRVRSYDLVHLFNLTLPEVTDVFAKNAVKHNVPFIVTTLQEDFPRFYHKAVAAWTWFKQYIPSAPKQRSALPPLAVVLSGATPKQQRTSWFAGKAANLLCACGETEAALVRTLFGHDRVVVNKFGSSIKESSAPASLFEQAFGITDFVLCVGRVEPRKNQLMLLHALEESDLPIVFVDGGSTSHEEYRDLCKHYPRKGPTIYTGRLSDDLLVSAYRACRVHCLPSWYELPGLVSLEAAQYGCAVVASSWGSLSDYLGDSCLWCSPDDPASIRTAIAQAFETPADTNTEEKARAFSWDTYAEKTLQHYEQVLQVHTAFSPELVAMANVPSEAAALFEFLERLTTLIEKGRFMEAIVLYDEKRPSFASVATELSRIDEIMERIRTGRTPR